MNEDSEWWNPPANPHYVPGSALNDGAPLYSEPEPDSRWTRQVVIDRPRQAGRPFGDRYVFLGWSSIPALEQVKERVLGDGTGVLAERLQKLLADPTTTVDVDVDHDNGRGFVVERRLQGPPLPEVPSVQHVDLDAFLYGLPRSRKMYRPSVAEMLRQRAKDLREQADRTDALIRIANTLVPGSPEELALWDLATR